MLSVCNEYCCVIDISLCVLTGRFLVNTWVTKRKACTHVWCVAISCSPPTPSTIPSPAGLPSTTLSARSTSPSETTCHMVSVSNQSKIDNSNTNICIKFKSTKNR